MHAWVRCRYERQKLVTPSWENKQRSGIRPEDSDLLSPLHYVVSKELP